MIRNKTARWTLGDEEYVRLLSEEHWAIYNGQRGSHRGYGPRIVAIEHELFNIIGEEKLNEFLKRQGSIWRYRDGAKVIALDAWFD